VDAQLVEVEQDVDLRVYVGHESLADVLGHQKAHVPGLVLVELDSVLLPPGLLVDPRLQDALEVGVVVEVESVCVLLGLPLLHFVKVLDLLLEEEIQAGEQLGVHIALGKEVALVPLHLGLFETQY